MGSIPSHMYTKPQGFFLVAHYFSYHRLHDLRGSSMVLSKMMLLEYVTHATLRMDKSMLPEHQDALRRQRASKCEGSCSCSDEIIQEWSDQNHIESQGEKLPIFTGFCHISSINQHYKLWLKYVKVRSTRQREQVPLLFPSSILSCSQRKPCMSFSQRKPCIVGGLNTLQKSLVRLNNLRESKMNPPQEKILWKLPAIQDGPINQKGPKTPLLRVRTYNPSCLFTNCKDKINV